MEDVELIGGGQALLLLRGEAQLKTVKLSAPFVVERGIWCQGGRLHMEEGEVGQTWIAGLVVDADCKAELRGGRLGPSDIYGLLVLERGEVLVEGTLFSQTREAAVAVAKGGRARLFGVKAEGGKVGLLASPAAQVEVERALWSTQTPVLRQEVP
ncbi:MAG: hypothetical protein WHT26_00495 [Thermus sp.]|uniref:hypothetical protein n=1 Tax=Thermus sp. TaxID=275 RepID=UPI0030A87A2D